jgi:GNAT superfamily N-acetyltransferase
MSGENVSIREAVADDIPLIMAFLRKKAESDGVPHSLRATPSGLLGTLFADPPMAFVVFAEVAGEPVGVASYFFTFSTFLARPGLWLDDLYVDDGFRSMGIGRALLAYLARLARSKDCARIDWTAAVDNGRGLEFYRRNGATVREGARLCRLDEAAIGRLAGGAEESRPAPVDRP